MEETNQVSTELTKEERIKKISDWVGGNKAVTAEAQALAKEILDRNLVDPNRSLVFEFMPFFEGYLPGVHIDHPIFGHFWINVLDEDKIQFLPWVGYWYDEITVSTHEDAVEFINDIDGKSEISLCKDEDSRKEIEKFEELIELITVKKNINKANILVFNLFNNYRSVIDAEILRIKEFFNAQNCIQVVNPDTEETIPLKDIKGDYDHLFLVDPVLFHTEDEETQKEINERLAAFRSLETRRAAIIYASQKVAALNDYEFCVNNGSALSGTPWRTVTIDKEGVVHTRNVFKAKTIKINSALEMSFGKQGRFT